MLVHQYFLNILCIVFTGNTMWSSSTLPIICDRPRESFQEKEKQKAIVAVGIIGFKK